MKSGKTGYIIAIIALSIISIVSTTIAVVEYLKIRDIRVAMETVRNIAGVSDNSKSINDLDLKDCKVIGLGETATFSTVKMTVTNVEKQKSYTKWQEVTAQEGAMFVVVEMEVENITKAPIEATIYDSDIYDFSNGTIYSCDWDAMIGNAHITEDIQPGMKAKISAIYTVSEKAGDLYHLSENMDTGEIYALALQ